VGAFILARKNDIFTASQTTQKTSSPVEGVMRQDPMKEFGWEVPYELAPLPSRGLVYSKNDSLHGKETISIKAMTAKEEDILLSRAFSKAGTTVSELLRSCITDHDVDVSQLLSGDRQSILVAIRITGYGSSYDAEVVCPACVNRVKNQFDLSSLTLRPLEIEPKIAGINEFEFTLPVSKKRVIFKFLTGRDEEELNTLTERRRKLLGDAAENPVTTKLAHQIISIEGITDKNKISTFVSNMPAGDSRALRSYIEKNEPGIDMNVQMTCPSCSAESEVGLPIGPSFFWPRT
jgi:hypothetical protein